MKLGEAGAKKQKSRKNLKLSLRGSVEIQAQHGPDRLHKLRAGSDENCLARPGPDRRAGLEERIHVEPEDRERPMLVVSR